MELKQFIKAPLTIVDFKILVEVENTASANGDVNAGLLKVVSADAGGSITHSSAKTHEVSFSIPLAWKKELNR